MKRRVTLTIEDSLLRHIDNSIDGNEIRNRSHAVELLLREAIQGHVPQHAVLLAGATNDGIKRVLDTYQNKTYLEHNIELCTQAGVQDIILITKYPDIIKQELPEELIQDIQFITESQALGTAGALQLAKPYLQSTFIVSNCDEKKDVDIQEMYQFHQQNNGTCTIALTTTQHPHEYGVALLNGNRIITFVEKPKQEQAPSNLISAGLYIMELSVLEHVPRGYGRIEYDIFPKLANNDELYGYPFSGEHHHL